MTKTRKTSTAHGDDGDDAQQQSPEEVLSQIESDSRVSERLQCYDPTTNELWMACGDGRHTVLLSSQKQLKNSVMPFRTKLSKELVKQFRSGVEWVDGRQLLHRVMHILDDYLYLRDQRLFLFLAVWLIGTYMYSIFSHYGYLFIHSKHPRSGKTRKQEVFSHLAFEANSPVNAPTPPTIRDMACRGGTVQLDTLERLRGKSPETFSAIMELLDAGFRKGGWVGKQVQYGSGEWRTREFPVYAPYVLAGISVNSLSDTAQDRSFSIEAFRKLRTVKKRRYNCFKCEQACEPIREDMCLWALQNASLVAAAYHSPSLEQDIDRLGLNDRAADIWRPLFAVLLLILGYDQETQEWSDLSSLAIEMHRDPEVREVIKQIGIMAALRQMESVDAHHVSGMTTDLLTHLQRKGFILTPSDLHKLMNQFGLAQRSVRLLGGPRRAWRIPVARLVEIEQQLRRRFPYIP